MRETVLVWDLETVPDTGALARIYGKSDREARALLGTDFPKLPIHKIVCIGAVLASRDNGSWTVEAIGGPHIGDRSEGDLISAFVDRIAELKPTLVTFNGDSFDLPVLRYRAMVHGIPAPGLFSRNYFNRYSADAVDLCDVLASYTNQAKASLDVICKTMGLRGKGKGIRGADVEAYVNEGRIREVSEYCETDVVNTFRLWLRYEVFRGALTKIYWEESEQALRHFVFQRPDQRSHLLTLFE